jgi:hypothetical protein
MFLRRRLVRALLTLTAVALLLPASAGARVPRGWLGVNLEPAPVVKHGSVDAELGRIAAAGARSVRVAVYWSSMQPYRSADRVPAGKRADFRVAAGVPTDFRSLDQLVTAAARHRLALLPVLLGAPRWAAAPHPAPVARPRDPADFARFAGALVTRYGTNGSFWAGRPQLPRVPIRTWQVWNEISNLWYWGAGWETEYPPLLRAAYDAIKAADAHAGVMMSGLNTGGAGGTNPQTSWSVMERLYGQFDAQGLGRPFDVAAVHIYTRRVGDAIRVVQATRDVMARFGDDRRPLRVTELAWPAAQGRIGKPFFAATTDGGMAQRLRQGILQLAGQRSALHIAGVDWFQWASSYSGTDDPFRYSGLRRIAGRRTGDRPALAAFRKLARSLNRP